MPRRAGIISALESVNEFVGRTVSWLALTLVLTTFAVAVLRYGFHVGWVWLQEAYVWMHGAIIMMAAGYTLLHDGHVRVDVFYRAMSARGRAWIDLLGLLFLLMPTLAVAGWMIFPYVLLSWQRWEVSLHPGGLPGVFLLKSTMFLFVVLLFIQALVMLVKCLQTLRAGGDPAGDATLPRDGL